MYKELIVIMECDAPLCLILAQTSELQLMIIFIINDSAGYFLDKFLCWLV